MGCTSDKSQSPHRFTKALDHIKAIRKEQTSNLKVDQERLTHLKVDRDKSGKVSSIDRLSRIKDSRNTLSQLSFANRSRPIEQSSRRRRPSLRNWQKRSRSSSGRIKSSMRRLRLSRLYSRPHKASPRKGTCTREINKV
jgi:phosphatidate phosphatase PAH1